MDRDEMESALAELDGLYGRLAELVADRESLYDSDDYEAHEEIKDLGDEIHDVQDAIDELCDELGISNHMEL